MILNDVSFQDKWLDRKCEHNYEAIFVNVLFILARWLKEMTFSCQIYHKQHNKWVNKCDLILHNL